MTFYTFTHKKRLDPQHAYHVTYHLSDEQDYREYDLRSLVCPYTLTEGLRIVDTLTANETIRLLFKDPDATKGFVAAVKGGERKIHVEKAPEGHFIVSVRKPAAPFVPAEPVG